MPKTYTNLLKEAITEFDTSKSVDVKGPMLDPIIAYDGGGELQTHKDVSSILERYYFEENEDASIVTTEDTLAADENEIDAIPGKAVAGTKTDIKDELTEAEEDTDVTKEEPAEVADDATTKTESELYEADIDGLENDVIERLIAEMEEDGTAGDVTLESNHEKGDTGAGTQAAGTGNADDQVPSRKDITKEEMELFEAEIEAADAEEKDITKDTAKDKDKDLDKEVGVKEEASSLPDDLTKDDIGDEDKALEEVFNIFKEEVEEMDLSVDEAQI